MNDKSAMSHARALASDLVTLKAIDIEVKLNASTTNAPY